MAKSVKCPRCQGIIDASNVSGGATIRCPHCGAMARVPTGETGVRPRVPTPSVPPPAVPRAAAAAGKREASGPHTAVRGRDRTRVIRKKSNAGVMIGITLAAVGFIAVVVVIAVNNRQAPPPPPPMADAPPHRPAPAKPEPGAPPSPKAAATPDESPAAKPAPVAGIEDPARAKWDEMMKNMRSGGGFDQMDRPEGVTFQRVKAMGKAAYPYIARYIDHEDMMLGRAAVSILNELTGRNAPALTAANKAQQKAEWDEWIKKNQ